jgi:hypothetical protein
MWGSERSVSCPWIACESLSVILSRHLDILASFAAGTGPATPHRCRRPEGALRSKPRIFLPRKFNTWTVLLAAGLTAVATRAGVLPFLFVKEICRW